MPVVEKIRHIQEIIPTIKELNLFLGYRNLEQQIESFVNKKSILIIESKAKKFQIPLKMRIQINDLDQQIFEVKSEFYKQKELVKNIPYGLIVDSYHTLNRVEIWEKVVPFLNINAEIIINRIFEITKDAEKEPIKLNVIGWYSLWIYKDFSYRVEKTALYTNEQIKLLIMEDFDKERRKFERLMHKFSTGENENNFRRPRIPESVRVEVWRRDGGKCARCGSRENLEYDHIVPISKGGSNTARNIELLCEKCNRSKGAEIA